MKKKFIIGILLTAPLAIFAQTAAKGPLDGKVFIVDVFKEGKKKPLDSPDNLKFAAGKFKSTYFADWGFTKPYTYDITSVDSSNGQKIYSWSTETVNDIKERMAWEGTIAGDSISGTSELTNKAGELKWKYTFNGKLKKKPGQK